MQFTRRRWLAAGTVVVALVLVVASFGLAQALRYAHSRARIAVQATPVASFDPRDESKTRFGRLEFRGGLALTANNDAFGGISALYMEPDGAHFLAVTDQSSWLRGRIVYRGGRPAAVAEAELAPMLGPDGKPLAVRGWYDTESLALGVDGLFYVGIERVERIVRFDVRKSGLRARGEPIAVPDDFRTFTYNKSLECLAAPPKGAPLAGALIAVTERSLDAAGNHRAFVLRGAQVERFTVKRSGDFDVSDCAVLPPADLLLLERRYSPLTGVAVRIRRLHLADIRDGALIDGEALFEADLGYQIDNMEGIGLHRNAQGQTILTLVSDDNFSSIQRTLLLQFALVGE
ncbi:MAG TPA: esterase-like activity of phytase family protein [Pseudolabrys sp.]|nr:esterase-like activity of phytase family protein [Pseudolabrys sp.]